eukprot:g9368.t1
MDSVGCVSGITSGELFFRASVRNDRSWLNQKVGPSLLKFLNDGIDRQSILGKFEAREDELNEAEEVCLQCRKNRTKALREKIVQANNLCKSYLSRSKLSYEDFVKTLVVLMDEFDDQAAKFALWYFSTLERERVIYRRRLGEEVTSCDSLQQHLKASLRLNIFAIHLESETDRQVLLKRLPSSHPQYIRCRRAASENLKPGFFDGAPSFNGINVLDVYKVENKPLLERFQSCAAMLEPGKVKGLFTSVPAKAVERTVVLGFGPLDHDAPYKRPKIIDEDEDDVLNGKGTDGKSLVDKAMAKLKPRKEDIFRRAWFAFHDKGDGYAEKIVDQASIATFPRTFSRYSTVEVDRFHIHESHRLKSNPGLATGENKESKMAKERWEKSTDGGGPVSDEIRYLILCRVVIGKVFVTSKEYRGFPTVGKNPAFDSMYNPLQEEYLVLRPVQVLPEFVIQYTYNNDASKVVSTLESSPILPVDLSTAGMKMPTAGWDLQISSPSTASPNSNNSSNDKHVKKAQKSDHEDNVRRAVPPTPTTSGIRLAQIPLDRENNNNNVNSKLYPKSEKNKSKSNNNNGASEMINVKLLEKRLKNQATETSRREALTSWEQLRLNAARQRETILDATDNLHASYKRKATQLRHWESARLRETFSGAPELESVQSMKHAIDRAEKDLMRQVARRREMENEMNSMKKKNNIRRR